MCSARTRLFFENRIETPGKITSSKIQITNKHQITNHKLHYQSTDHTDSTDLFGARDPVQIFRFFGEKSLRNQKLETRAT